MCNGVLNPPLLLPPQKKQQTNKQTNQKLTISIRGSSIAGREASIPIASISGGDNSGRGRGQTGENRDLQ